MGSTRRPGWRASTTGGGAVRVWFRWSAQAEKTMAIKNIRPMFIMAPLSMTTLKTTISLSSIHHFVCL